MRKPVFPRIFLRALLYSAVFVVLAMIQFTKRGSFTQKAGSFVVSGQYRLPDEGEAPVSSNEYLLDGDAHVFFGGMDFCIVNDDEENSFRLVAEDGTTENLLPVRMQISDDSVFFIFSNGTIIEFIAMYSGGSLEMRISGDFPEGIAGADLPFEPLRRSGIRDTGDGQFIVNADGVNYTFGRSTVDAEASMLNIREGAEISYRAIPERRAFSPEDFIIAQAQTETVYNDFLGRWTDRNFSLWNRTISGQGNEDVVIAYGGEAIARGTYKAAVAAVPPLFMGGAGRTYESSVYLGGLNQAYRSLIAREREKLAFLSRQINEASYDFLKEPHVFEYFAVRGHLNLFDAAAELVRTIDPVTIGMDITPGILEGYVDWKIFRPAIDNPFERLVNQACFVISESLHRTANNPAVSGDFVFAFYGSRGDTEFNLRLGKALLVYSEIARDSSWAGVGRSMIVSALSLADASGAVKAGLLLSDTSEISEDGISPDLTSAGLYRILNTGEYFPRAAAIGSSVNAIWTWTAARTLSASQENNVLDITVNFPAGETHYMIIRGIRPFDKIQLYNMDFRTDPQFERYDSSGWSYNQQEQVLIVKMKHRTQEEHIRVFFSR